MPEIVYKIFSKIFHAPITKQEYNVNNAILE